MSNEPRLLLLIPLCACGLFTIGCGGKGIAVKPIHGEVTVSGKKVETGRLRFVSIDGCEGPVSVAKIENGQYRIEDHGGVPIGRHRVEVYAFRRTGRTFSGDEVSETGMTEETVSIAPAEYAGPKSPLTVEVTAESDGKIDIHIPAAR